MESEIKRHYTSDELIGNIENGLQKAGKDITNLKLKDLAPVDQLHTCGAPATLALIEKSKIRKDSKVLDAGCGLGGSSRLIANIKQCRVLGIDLSESFIQAAKILTKYTRLDHLVEFHSGSIMSLPFEDESFDAVLCQHLLVNIEQKDAVIREFLRILKPRGELIFHEVAKGKGPEILFPVPWASDSAISFIEPWEEYERLFQEQGFTMQYFKDDTHSAVKWWEKIRTSTQKNDGKAFPLGVHLIFGANAVHFKETMFQNFRNNSIQLIEAIFLS